MGLADWFLTPEQRGNPSTTLDVRRSSGLAWASGNDAQPLIHGSTYFATLLGQLAQTGPGALVMFTDWRGDPDEALDDHGTTVSRALCDAVARGATVRGLVWRSHWDRLSFSERENRHLGEEIEAVGGKCLLDMRVRPGGSHHQKFVVLRHRDHPDRDVAFVGGIDLCHGRRDDADHGGDPQQQPMASVYGDRPPWHDVQLALRGPVVSDVEWVFRERWNDPTPLSRNPIHRGADLLRRQDRRADALPSFAEPAAAGPCHVQLLRTYPKRHPGYPFARDGERSVARGYAKAIANARSLIYVEDQYLWSKEITGCFAEALRQNASLRLIVVIPHFPDQDGKVAMPPNLLGRAESFALLRAAAADRFAVYGIENHAGTPVYVHAKVCVVDDVWATVGSDNVNRRSWTHDSELTCAVIDDERDDREPLVLDRFDDGARRFARDLRLALAREHLDRADDRDGAASEDDLLDPITFFDAFASSAARLQQWHDSGRIGPRPPGRLRRCAEPRLSRVTRAWATPLYRKIFDPDGRPIGLRRTDSF